MLRDEIHKKLEKKQEPNLQRCQKPLPVPVFESKRKRGGRPLRKMKESYAFNDIRKLANRAMLVVPEESSLRDGIGSESGMLVRARSTTIRLSASTVKLGVKVDKKSKWKHNGRHGAASGLASSLAFTPFQGILLLNPQADMHQLVSGVLSTYFI